MVRKEQEIYKKEDLAQALLRAADNGNLKLVKKLLARNSAICDTIDAQDIGKQTPLWWACANGHVEVARLLLQRGASVDAPSDYGETPLQRACSNGHTDIVSLLLNSNAKVNSRDVYGKTPLFDASYSGHVDVVRILLQNEFYDDINDDDGDHIHHDMNAFYRACEQGHLLVVKLFLKHGFHINGMQNRFADTPLHCACKGGKLNVVKLLLTRGANIRSTTNHGMAPNGSKPFHLACYEGHLDVVKLLLEAGASVHERANHGMTLDGPTPIHCASLNGHLDVVQFLLQEGANPHLKASHFGIEEMLLRKGRWQFENLDGLTPLHCACYGGHLEVVQFLLTMGVDVTARTDSGDTALNLVRHWDRNKEIVALLKADEKAAKHVGSPLNGLKPTGSCSAVNTKQQTPTVLHEVFPEHDAYWLVTDELRSGMRDGWISRLWRIDNDHLEKYYQFQKDRLTFDTPSTNNIGAEGRSVPHERFLWHGTSKWDPSLIYKCKQDGFRVQLARKGLWGRGIYFALDSSYSHSFAYNPRIAAGEYQSAIVERDAGGSPVRDDEREMFLVKVFIGDEIEMNLDGNNNGDESARKMAHKCKELKLPPINKATGRNYDTVTGRIPNGSSKVWIVYENGRALPMYLVRYYRGPRDPNRTPYARKANRSMVAAVTC